MKKNKTKLIILFIVCLLVISGIVFFCLNKNKKIVLKSSETDTALAEYASGFKVSYQSTEEIDGEKYLKFHITFNNNVGRDLDSNPYYIYDPVRGYNAALDETYTVSAGFRYHIGSSDSFCSLGVIGVNEDEIFNEDLEKYNQKGQLFSLNHNISIDDEYLVPLSIISDDDVGIKFNLIGCDKNEKTGEQFDDSTLGYLQDYYNKSFYENGIDQIANVYFISHEDGFEEFNIFETSHNNPIVKAVYDEASSNSKTAVYNFDVTYVGKVQNNDDGVNYWEEEICDYKGCEYKNGVLDKSYATLKETISYERGSYPKFIKRTYIDVAGFETTMRFLVQAKGKNGPACVSKDVGNLGVGGFYTDKVECFSEIGFDEDHYLELYNSYTDDYTVESFGDDNFASTNGGVSTNYYSVTLKMTANKASDKHNTILAKASSLVDDKGHSLDTTYSNGTWTSYLYSFDITVNPMLIFSGEAFDNAYTALRYGEDIKYTITCVGNEEDCGQNYLDFLISHHPGSNSNLAYYDLYASDNFFDRLSYLDSDTYNFSAKLRKKEPYYGEIDYYAKNNINQFVYDITVELDSVDLIGKTISFATEYRPSAVRYMYFNIYSNYYFENIVFFANSKTMKIGDSLEGQLYSTKNRTIFMDSVDENDISVYKLDDNNEYQLIENNNYNLSFEKDYSDEMIILEFNPKNSGPGTYKLMLDNKKFIDNGDFIDNSDLNQAVFVFEAVDKPYCQFTDSDGNVINEISVLYGETQKVGINCDNYDYTDCENRNAKYCPKDESELLKHLILNINSSDKAIKITKNSNWDGKHLEFTSTATSDGNIFVEEGTLSNRDVYFNDEVALKVKTIQRPTCTVSNSSVVVSKSGFVVFTCKSPEGKFEKVTPNSVLPYISSTNTAFNNLTISNFTNKNGVLTFRVNFTALRKGTANIVLENNAFTDTTGIGVLSASGTVTATADTTAPSCHFETPTKTEIRKKETSTVTLVCTDKSAITTKLTKDNIKFNNLLALKVDSVKLSYANANNTEVHYDIVVKRALSGKSPVKVKSNIICDEYKNCYNGEIQSAVIKSKLL